MAIFRVKKTNDYTVMSNYHLRDKNLTLKAKGLLSWMLSNTDDWDYSVAGIVANVKESKDAVNSALTELEDRGYLHREQKREGGKFGDIEYVIYEKPFTENPLSVNPTTENPQQRNTNITNTKNKEIPKKENIPFSKIVSYLNDKAGTSFRSSSKDTQKHIIARWNDGYRLDDFFRVIDVKVTEWRNDKKMAQYLRPSTLFGTKFESYLQQYREPQKKDNNGSELVRNEDGSLMTF